MEIESIVYPGFNKNLKELNAIAKLKKQKCEILDFTEIEWVREVLKQRISEIGEYEVTFKLPNDKEFEEVSRLVGADIDPEELKNNFHKNKRIIGITSGKGGVGKSTITALLGIAFDELGKKVGIMDSDIWGYSIPKNSRSKISTNTFQRKNFSIKN